MSTTTPQFQSLQHAQQLGWTLHPNRKATACKKCTAPIRFGQDPAGKWYPMEPDLSLPRFHQCQPAPPPTPPAPHIPPQRASVVAAAEAAAAAAPPPPATTSEPSVTTSQLALLLQIRDLLRDLLRVAQERS